MLGATFIHVNISLAILRKKHINTNAKKIGEAIFFAFVTASMFYCAVLARQGQCFNESNMNSEEIEESVPFMCSEDD